MLVCLPIVRWVPHVSDMQFLHSFNKNDDFCTKSKRLHFGSLWGLAEQNYEGYSCLVQFFDDFSSTFTQKFHRNVMFGPIKMQPKAKT